jgi:hypothetical protein
MSHRIDLFCEDLRQKLTIIESGLQGLKAKVEANEVHAERDVRNHLDRVRIPGDTGMERQPQCFPPCGVHSSRIAAGNASIPRPPRPPADLIRQSGLVHKADRPNESHRANVREPHTEL